MLDDSSDILVISIQISYLLLSCDVEYVSDLIGEVIDGRLDYSEVVKCGWVLFFVDSYMSPSEGGSTTV